MAFAPRILGSVVLAGAVAASAALAQSQTQLLGHLPGCGGFEIAAFDDWDGDLTPDIVRSCSAMQILLVSGSNGLTLGVLPPPLNATTFRLCGTIQDLDQDTHPEVIAGETGGVPVPGLPGFYTTGSVAAY